MTLLKITIELLLG